MGLGMPLQPLAVPPAGKHQSGAFDLPSILIGVAVVAILAVGVMAAVFGVIPWAQDRAAQQDLAAVSTAQGTAYAHGGSFADKAALIGAGWLGQGTPAALETRADPEGKCYVAVTASKTGDRFIVSSGKPAPRPAVKTDRWCSGELVNPDTAPVMISTWDTRIADICKTITLPVTGFKGTVNWGDGTTDSKASHTYTTSGEVTIRIDGTFATWGGVYEDSVCVLSVDRWGATETATLSYAFAGSDSLRHVEAIPGTTTNLSHAFENVDSNFTLGALDTFNVANFSYMFFNTSAFNQPLTFVTPKATTTRSMFQSAVKFNQPVDHLDTSNATTIKDMFYTAREFNQPVPFDTSQVTDMVGTFHDAPSFNQPVQFNTSQVTDMRQMFDGAATFNQDLSGWNVAAVTSRISFDYGTSAWTLPKPKWAS